MGLEDFNYRDAAAKALKNEENKQTRQEKLKRIQKTPEYLSSLVKHAVKRGRLLEGVSKDQLSTTKPEKISQAEYLKSKYNAEISEFTFIFSKSEDDIIEKLGKWEKEGGDVGTYVYAMLSNLDNNNNDEVQNLKLAKIKLKDLNEKYDDFVNFKASADVLSKNVKDLIDMGKGARLITALKPLMEIEGLSYCPLELATLLAVDYEKVMKKDQPRNERLLVASKPCYDGDYYETLEVSTDNKGMRHLEETCLSSLAHIHNKLDKNNIETYVLFTLQE